MIPGYHAGEMWLHEPARAIDQLATMGYRSVAIRSRQGICVPGESAFDTQWGVVLKTAAASEIDLIIDTEAPFVLGGDSPSAVASAASGLKSSAMPSLASDDDSIALQTVRWIERWITAASMRPGTIISFASGPLADTDTEHALERLAGRMERLCGRADDAGVHLALRPAVSHVIGSVAQFERLRQWLTGDVSLGLAADVGEMIQAGEMPLVSRLRRQSGDLRLVYLCDTVSDEHDPTPEYAVGRMDVPVGSGEVAIDRIVSELAKFTDKVPIVIRVANHSASGLAQPRQAMDECEQVPAWRNACQRARN